MFDFDGVIFDLDGTIADSLYVWKKVDIDFFGKRGMEIPENYSQKISSMSFNEAACFTKKEYNFFESVEEIMNEWYDMAVEEYSHNVELKPFAKDFFKYVAGKGAKIALCTASPRELFEPFLKNNGVFEYFDTFVSGTEVGKGKEFPDIYLLAAKRLGVLPERCIVFEDILKAIRGAKAAGMTVVGVFDGNGEDDVLNIKKEADKFIYDFSEMMI